MRTVKQRFHDIRTLTCQATVMYTILDVCMAYDCRVLYIVHLGQNHRSRICEQDNTLSIKASCL